MADIRYPGHICYLLYKEEGRDDHTAADRYHHIKQHCAAKTNQKNDDVPKSNPETGELSHYQKKLLYNKQYYEKNKEELLKKQKQYKDKKTAFQKTRERTVQLLNSSSDYAKKIRPTTLEKYMIYFDDETSRWKWREE
jgi:hypothetical protein